jgi:hypothetical protein
MKKLILNTVTALIAIFFIATVQAQTEKGSWIAGGSASFNSIKPSGLNSSVTMVSVMPGAGYFVTNNLAIGAQVQFQSASESYSTFSAAPFVRYYFLPLGANASLFANGSFGYGTFKFVGGNSNSFTLWQLAAGPEFFLSKNIGLEFSLAYGSTTLGSITTSNKTLGLNIGFQIHFNKKGK